MYPNGSGTGSSSLKGALGFLAFWSGVLMLASLSLVSVSPGSTVQKMAIPNMAPPSQSAAIGAPHVLYPSARTSSSMVYDAADGYVLLFGGASLNGTSLNDTWVYSGGSWTQLHPAVSPPPRSVAMMTYDPVDRYVVLFGGSSSKSWIIHSSRVLPDTWAFKGGKWRQIFPSQSPGARSFGSISFDGLDGYVLLFGGIGKAPGGVNRTYYDDTWRYVGGNWTQLYTPASLTPDYGSIMTYDRSSQSVVMEGGVHQNATGSFKLTRYTWTYSRGSWSRVNHLSAHPLGVGNAIAYDPPTHAVVVYAGQSQPTYLFSNGTWTQLKTATAPIPLDGESLAFDSADHYLLMFGGSTNSMLTNSTWGFWSGNWHAL